jgi:NADH dehydrogenase FAD-containing subunit
VRRRYPWLRLYTAEGNLVPTQAEAAHQRAERLAQRLRELGVDPESL